MVASESANTSVMPTPPPRPRHQSSPKCTVPYDRTDRRRKPTQASTLDRMITLVVAPGFVGVQGAWTVFLVWAALHLLR